MRRSGHSSTAAGVGALLWMLCIHAGPAAAQAPAAEDRYIAARDAGIARFAPDKMKTVGKPAEAEEAAIRADLEKQMRAIVGPVAQPGFGPGKFNLETLFGELGFGTLDGLVFSDNGGKTSMIVTTRTLFMRWLRGHRNWGRQSPMPQEPGAAFRTEAFYTQAISTDATIVKFADIPLGVPDKSAHAMLGWRTQDNTPGAAGEVFVAALRGDRAFVANASFEPVFAIEACTAPRVAAEKKLDQTTNAELAPNGDFRAANRRSEQIRDRIAADFKRCFAERAPKEPRFAEMVKLAKALYERMPAR
jgi:hypothetical protein